MILKNACIIAIVVMLLSILLNIGGNIIFYAMLFADNFHAMQLITPVIFILISLLVSGGFIMLLMAMINRLNNPDSGGNKSLFILDGILILMAALINMAITITTCITMYQHMPQPQLLFYLYMYIPGFLANLTLGLFAITQAGNSSGKVLGMVTLIIHLFVLAIALIHTVRSLPNNFNYFGTVQNIGYMAMALGSFANLAAIIFFLLMFLLHRPWPPMATITDPSPDPLPTLSTAQTLPE